MALRTCDIKRRARRWSGADCGWCVRSELLGLAIQSSSQFKWHLVWDWEVLKLGPGELVALLPSFVLHTAASAAASLRLTHLLKPEAGGRRVQQAQQCQMIVL